MTNAFSPDRADSLVEWSGALLFAALVGYALFLIGSPITAAVGGLAAGALAQRILRLASDRSSTAAAFVPAPFDEVLDQADELLLDDPLQAPESSSRVVQLFAGDEATPAALVARIEDYLGRGGERVAHTATEQDAPRQADASAALHAALSNIRASLR